VVTVAAVFLRVTFLPVVDFVCAVFMTAGPARAYMEISGQKKSYRVGHNAELYVIDYALLKKCQ
jgi:hypothetical protein